jgi:hypothetical protein
MEKPLPKSNESPVGQVFNLPEEMAGCKPAPQPERDYCNPDAGRVLALWSSSQGIACRRAADYNYIAVVVEHWSKYQV